MQRNNRVVTVIFSLLICFVQLDAAKAPWERLRVVAHRHALQAQQLFGLCPFGRGTEGANELRAISLSYQKRGGASLPDIRKALVALVQHFHVLINQERSLRPYFHSFPFRVEDIRLSIVFLQADGCFVQPPQIAYAISSGGNIRYAVEKEGRLDDVCEETFEQALRALSLLL